MRKIYIFLLFLAVLLAAISLVLIFEHSLGLHAQNTAEQYIKLDVLLSMPSTKNGPLRETGIKPLTSSNSQHTKITKASNAQPNSQSNLASNGNDFKKSLAASSLPEQLSSNSKTTPSKQLLRQTSPTHIKDSVVIEALDHGSLSIPWKEFLNISSYSSSYVTTDELKQSLQKEWSRYDVELCPPKLVKSVTQPALSDEKFKWCKWALSNTGGNVQVGKSYGTLNGKQREDYEQFNCNAVAKGVNPPCDYQWGDPQINTWKNSPSGELCRSSSQPFSQVANNRGSKVQCFDSQSEARFCVFENVMLDFSKMHNVPRTNPTPSRSWDTGFLATDCDPSIVDIKYYKFYAPSVDPEKATCDYVIRETVVEYSHDDIHNLGHTMSDLMNVWAMMWLSGLGPHSRRMSLLNIDAIRQGHNYNDELSVFFRHYELNFHRILKASEFKPNSKVCFKKLLFQPQPVILFTWDGWWQDMQCSFVGPSSLFQRWNLQIRKSYDLIPIKKSSSHDNNNRKSDAVKIRILLILRKAPRSTNVKYISRVFKNEKEIEAALKSLPNTEIIATDLSKLDFVSQVRLISNVSIIVGMHGAGIASSMHMAVGTSNCCGVIEIFPPGEFMPIRGYGNMARRMGHRYERIELDSSSGGGESYVTPKAVLEKTKLVISDLSSQSSCVLPSVIDDPYFLS